MNNLVKLVLVAGATLGWTAAAGATTLTFDSTADCATSEVTITKGAAGTACTLNNPFFGTTPPSGSRSLAATSGGNSAPGDDFFTAAFNGHANGISVELGDIGSVFGDEDRLFLRGFDAAGGLLEEVTKDILATFRGTNILSLTASNVAKITFGVTADLGTGKGIFADNLTFAIAEDVAPVPLPASALLLLGGVAGFGALRRRRGA